MTNFKSKTEAQILENSRVALENLVNQSEIATMMAEFGYSAETMNTGNQLYAAARAAFDKNKTEDDETRETRAVFDQKYEALQTTYALHRKKAKVVFRNNEVTLKNLGLTGRVPEAYVSFMEKARNFYRLLEGNNDLMMALAGLKFAPEEVTATLAAIEQVEAARAEYLREVGESQDATKSKDAALATLDDWMRNMYDVARIALDDQPQLLEALGLLVRS
ncbi:MAG: hypothetical protein JXR65_01610 [Bacteroidales bacterium]|nr:hypothetical protein [Bacteroidales bacterium]